MRQHLLVVLLGVVASVAGCASSSPRPPQVSPVAAEGTTTPPRAEASDARGTDSLGWLLADAVGVLYSRPDHAGLIRWATVTLQQDRPACFEEAVASLDGTFQVSRSGGQKALNVAHGRLERDRFESCLGEVLGRLGLPLAFQREGRLTRVSTPSGASSYLGWTEDGYLLWHDDRAFVEQLVTAPRPTVLDPDWARFLSRVEPKAAMWAVPRMDVTSRLLGQSSRGFFFSTPPISPSTSQLLVSLVFDTREQVEGVVLRIGDKQHDETLPEPIRALLAELHPVLHDNEVVVDVKRFFTDPQVAQSVSDFIVGSPQAPAP